MPLPVVWGELVGEILKTEPRARGVFGNVLQLITSCHAAPAVECRTFAQGFLIQGSDLADAVRWRAFCLVRGLSVPFSHSSSRRSTPALLFLGY